MSEHVPWPSFDNYSIAFARRLLDREALLATCALIIQRWWRKQPIHPLVVGKECSALLACSRAKKGLECLKLDDVVCATEKLDGTNLGVRDDGRLLGRRHLLPKGTLRYQSTPVDSVASERQVSNVRDIIARGLAVPPSLTLRLILYGELMCNARYDYASRKLVNRWRCFGARVWLERTGESKVGEDEGVDEDELEQNQIESGDSSSKDSSSGCSSGGSSSGCSKEAECELKCEEADFVIIDESYFDALSPRRAEKGSEVSEGKKHVVDQPNTSSSESERKTTDGGGRSGGSSRGSGSWSGSSSGSDTRSETEFDTLYCSVDTCTNSAVSVCSCCCLPFCASEMLSHSDSKGMFPTNTEDFNLSARLLGLGLWVTGGLNKHYKHGDKLTLPFSPNLQKLLFSQHVEQVPLVLTAPLRVLLAELQPRMLGNEWEGVVLVQPRTLHKWKTGVEDESQGRVELARALALPPWLLHPAEIEVGQLLLRVAANRPEPTEKTTTARGVKTKGGNNPYTKEQLQRAYSSALTKYDSLEVYFARGANALKSLTLELARELVDDLGAQTPDEIAIAERYAKSEVGGAYGKWIKQEKS